MQLTVDMFRRKTVNLDVECMIYFDIGTGNIVSCYFADECFPDEVGGVIYENLIDGMNIASVHNHPIQYCSPPSGKNFQMLGFEFEKYELILSKNELWVLESKNVVNHYDIESIRKNADKYFNLLFEDAEKICDEGYIVWDNCNKYYGDFLLNYINNNFNNIILTRRYLNG